MSQQDITEEDVFSNDVDPLEGIRALRKEEQDSLPEEEKAELEKEDGEELTSSLDVDPAEDPAEEEETPEEDFDIQKEGEVEGEEEDLDEKDPEADEVVEAVKRKFKAQGKEFEFTEKEMLDQFESVFGQAMDYTQKLQKISPYRKMISAIEEEGLSQDQLNLALDALKGNKDAIQKIMEMNEVDSFDLPEESGDYIPTEYGKDEFQAQLQEITEEISKDTDIYPVTVDVIDNQWDSESRKQFAANPKMITALHEDIKSGLYDQVAPVAMKMKVLDGNSKSDIEYYMLAGQQVVSNQQSSQKQTVEEANRKAQEAVRNSDKASSEADRKRAASVTKSRADRKGVIDYLDDDDEAFDAWYKKVQASS